MIQDFLTGLTLLLASPAHAALIAKYPANNITAVSIASADFNSDKLDDIAVASFGSIAVYMNLGNNQYKTIQVGKYPSNNVTAVSLTASDVNGDGKIDLVYASGGSISSIINPCWNLNP